MIFLIARVRTDRINRHHARLIGARRALVPSGFGLSATAALAHLSLRHAQRTRHREQSRPTDNDRERTEEIGQLRGDVRR